MKKTSKTIVFFGSGPVAAKSLELLKNSFEIEAVITKPKPAHHRGSTPVLDVARKLQLPTHTVTDKKSLDELIASKPFRSDVAILIDFGIIVSKKVISYFPYGIINSHFSLLPEWRGADPITFSILSGQEQTGVSLMLLVEAMDEGPLLAQSIYELPPTITTPELTEDLILLSHKMLEQIVPLYVSGKAKPAPQETATMAPSAIPSYSRKLTKEDGVLDWQKPATQLEREIRAYIEWPKSRCTLANKAVIITKAETIKEQGPPGKAIVKAKQLLIFCGQDALVIEKLKPAGKREMSAKEFLAGYGNRL